MRMSAVFFAVLSCLMLGRTVEATPPAALLASTCAGCHGSYGVSDGPSMPNIAGMPANYMKKRMREYKQGSRPSTIMGRLARGYSDEEIALMARFFAKQAWVSSSGRPVSGQSTPIDASLVEQGATVAKTYRCDLCHENGGRFQDDDTPRLAGQWLDYLQRTLQDLHDPTREVPQPAKMRQQIRNMSQQERDAVAYFYAHQK